LSGFGKSGIGAYSETCEQFHEFGAQSIAARRGVSIPAIPISRSRRSRSPIPIDPDQYGAVC
jgi:hypothetical protein